MRLFYLAAVMLLVASCTDTGCRSDADCVAAQCCHPTGCCLAADTPDCEGILCTQECAPGSMDCGQGRCSCVRGACEAVLGE
jgi:hypothetical protein